MKEDVKTQAANGVLKVTKDYLSRDDLRAMAVGQTIEFVIPDEKLESASSTCSNMRFERKKYSKKIRMNADGASITVTREM